MRGGDTGAHIPLRVVQATTPGPMLLPGPSPITCPCLPMTSAHPDSMINVH